MPDPSLLRRELDRWANQHPRPPISTLPSNCACEEASSPEGSFGPVGDYEILIYIVTSRSTHDLKRRRPFNATKLKRVFDVGLSTIREAYASDQELEESVKLLADDNKERWGSEFGGVVELVCFSCERVRRLFVDDDPTKRVFCVYETPDFSESSYCRPSHADVVAAEIAADDDIRSTYLGDLFNAIKKEGNTHPILEYRDGLLAHHAPEVISVAVSATERTR